MRTNSKNVHRILRYRSQHSNPSNTNGSEPIDPDETDLSYIDESVANSYKQKQKSLTDAELELAVQRYSEGASTYELAAQFGCHRSTISRALKKSGIEVTHEASKREALTKQVLQRYADFNRPVDIGKVLGINVSTVRKILHENNVHIRHSSEYSSKVKSRNNC